MRFPSSPSLHHVYLCTGSEITIYSFIRVLQHTPICACSSVRQNPQPAMKSGVLLALLLWLQRCSSRCDGDDCLSCVGEQGQQDLHERCVWSSSLHKCSVVRGRHNREESNETIFYSDRSVSLISLHHSVAHFPPLYPTKMSYLLAKRSTRFSPRLDGQVGTVLTSTF